MASNLFPSVYRNNAQGVQGALREGEDPNARDSGQNTPLHITARYGYLESLDQLLQHGANPNLVNTDGWTPLMVAASKARIHAVRALLMAGAKPSIQDRKGRTALDLTPGSEKRQAQMIKMAAEMQQSTFSWDALAAAVRSASKTSSPS